MYYRYEAYEIQNVTQNLQNTSDRPAPSAPAPASTHTTIWNLQASSLNTRAEKLHSNYVFGHLSTHIKGSTIENGINYKYPVA